MFCGSLRGLWGWSLFVGLLLGNCAWVVNSMDSGPELSVAASTIACPQYREVEGQVTFYPSDGEPVLPHGSHGQRAVTPVASAVSIDLEIAETPAQKQCGLMFRDRLPDNRGMGFPFDPPTPVSFRMKNVPVALDMIFIQNNVDRRFGDEPNTYQVQEIITAPPCTADPCPNYRSAGNVAWVIELAEGRAAAMGLKKGDRLEIRRSP